MTEFSTLYVTAVDADEAATLGRDLLERRLVACVNIFPQVRSLYRWKGEICDEPETVLICKTRADLAEKAMERVRKIHSYDCPCVVALPLAAGNPDYLEWIAAETAAD